MNQKEERKTVVSRYGWLKTRSHNAARGFRNTVSAVLLPQLPKALNHAKKTDKTSRKYERFASIFVEMTAITSLSFPKFARAFWANFKKMIAPVSFCFLWRHLCRYTSLSFFFGKKKRKKVTNKKESLIYTQNIRLNQI